MHATTKMQIPSIMKSSMNAISKHRMNQWNLQITSNHTFSAIRIMSRKGAIVKTAMVEYT